jgi:hypothetical protein
MGLVLPQPWRQGNGVVIMRCQELIELVVGKATSLRKPILHAIAKNVNRYAQVATICTAQL